MCSQCSSCNHNVRQSLSTRSLYRILIARWLSSWCQQDACQQNYCQQIRNLRQSAQHYLHGKTKNKRKNARGSRAVWLSGRIFPAASCGHHRCRHPDRFDSWARPVAAGWRRSAAGSRPASLRWLSFRLRSRTLGSLFRTEKYTKTWRYVPLT